MTIITNRFHHPIVGGSSSKNFLNTSTIGIRRGSTDSVHSRTLKFDNERIVNVKSRVGPGGSIIEVKTTESSDDVNDETMYIIKDCNDKGYFNGIRKCSDTNGTNEVVVSKIPNENSNIRLANGGDGDVDCIRPVEVFDKEVEVIPCASTTVSCDTLQHISAKVASVEQRSVQEVQVGIGFGSNYYYALKPHQSKRYDSEDETQGEYGTKDDSHKRRKSHCVYEWTTDDLGLDWKTQTTTSEGMEVDGVQAVAKEVKMENPDEGQRECSTIVPTNRSSSNCNDTIQQIACTSQSTIFLTSCGSVYQQGTIHGVVLTRPSLISFPGTCSIVSKTRKVIQLAAGKHFCLALLENGSGVYAWGAGHFGQLGVGHPGSSTNLRTIGKDEMVQQKSDKQDEEKRFDRYGQLVFTMKPILIESLLPQNTIQNSPVISIVAGDYHSLALTRAGNVYSWGSNRTYQCGIDPETFKSSNEERRAHYNTALSKFVEPEPPFVYPTLSSATDVGEDEKRNMVKVDKLSPTDRSCVDLDPTIKVNVDIPNGQILDDTLTPLISVIMTPTPIQLPIRVTQIAAGKSHSVAVGMATSATNLNSSSGIPTSTSMIPTVFSWGCNQDGQCGVNRVERYSKPGILPLPVKGLQGIHVTSVAAGALHTLALTSTGKVLAWGDNSEGQLGCSSGLLNGIGQSKPKIVSVFENEQSNITNDNKTGPLVSRQHLLNSTSVLSATSSSNQGTTKPHNQAVLSKTSLEATPRVKAIHASGNYSVAISTSGHVYVWGSNDNGQLGLVPPKSEKEFPFLRDGGKIPSMPNGCESVPVTRMTTNGKQVVIGSRQRKVRKMVRNVHTFESNHNVLFPTRNEAVNHVNVQTIACGPNHMWIMGVPRLSCQVVTDSVTCSTNASKSTRDDGCKTKENESSVI